MQPLERRNTIVTLLADWGLLTIITPAMIKNLAPLRQIKVIPFKEKTQWELCPKYNIGNSNNGEKNKRHLEKISQINEIQQTE